MERYGSDKPDLRFGMELVDLAPALGEGSTGFRVFDEALAAGGRVKAIAAPGMADASRSQIDELVAFARRFGAKGLAHVSVAADGTGHSPIGKFLGDERIAAIVKAAAGEAGRPDPDRRRRRPRGRGGRPGPPAPGAGPASGPGR